MCGGKSEIRNPKSEIVLSSRPVTVEEALRSGATILPTRDGIPDPRREAVWLLAAAWGVEEITLRLHPERELPVEVETSTQASEFHSAEIFPTDKEQDVQAERPVLTGFVLARPELEPDVRRRVLAALRYAGELRLVGVGDTSGGDVVERMEARDSVTLTHADTGEHIRLTLE